MTRSFRNRRTCECSCRNYHNKYKKVDTMPIVPQLANAYVPYQDANEMFCPGDSLENGTAFPELVSPYHKNQSQEIISYLKNTKLHEEDGRNEL